jgi:hypothetical protein
MPAGWEIMKGEMGGEDLVPRLPDSFLPEREQLAAIPEQRSHSLLRAIGQHLLEGVALFGNRTGK